MKIKDYNQMMRYLTSTGEFTRNRGVSKDKVKPHSVLDKTSQRIAELHHVYDGGPKPNNLTNKPKENMKTTDRKLFKQPKKNEVKPFIKKVEPLKIDVSGIDVGLTELENTVKPSPAAEPAPIRRKEPSKGLAYLLGVDE